MVTIYPLTVRLTENERDRIHALAEGEHRSTSNMLHVLVVEALAAREAKAAQK
jgi:predicted transcriptional regulator